MKLQIVMMSTLLCAPMNCLAEHVDAESVLANVRNALRLAARPTHMLAQGDADFQGSTVPFSLTSDINGLFTANFGGTNPMALGFDGVDSWTASLGSTPRKISMAERDGALLGNWIVTGDWARQASVVRVSDARAGEGVIVLSFGLDHSPLNGTITIDRTTHLPREMSWSAGATTTTVTVKDYRSFGSIQLPTHIEQTTTNGEPLRVRIKEARALAACDVGAFAMPEDDAAVTFDLTIPTALEIKRAPTGHLLVKTMVDGKDVGWFILDTGAGANVLNAAVARDLGLQPFGSVAALGAGGTTMTELYKASSLSVGQMTTTAPVFIGLDLTPFEPHFGVKLGGIVGYPALSRTIVEYDLERGEIALHDPRTFKRDGVQWSTMSLYQGHPCIEAGFEGHSGVFVLDTGAAGSGMTIYYDSVRDLNLLEERQTTEGALGGAGGMVKARNGSVRDVSLAGHSVGDTSASFVIEQTGAFADAYLMGNIGGEALRPFVLLIDYPGSRIAFLKRQE